MINPCELIDFAIKTEPKFLKAAIKGEKLFTVRKNDRNYKAGMVIRKRGYSKESGFTTDCADFLITYVLTDKDFPKGIKRGYCVCGLKLIKDHSAAAMKEEVHDNLHVEVYYTPTKVWEDKDCYELKIRVNNGSTYKIFPNRQDNVRDMTQDEIVNEIKRVIKSEV